MGREEDFTIGSKDAQLDQLLVSAHRFKALGQPLRQHFLGQELVFEMQRPHHVTGITHRLVFSFLYNQVIVGRMNKKKIVTWQEDGNCQGENQQVANQPVTQHIIGLLHS